MATSGTNGGTGGGNGRTNLSELALRNSTLTVFFMVVLTLAGVFAYFSLGRGEDPPFTIKQMVVSAAWPGATAREVEQQVTDKIETKLQELPFFYNVTSYTKPGETVIYVSLRDDVPPAKVADLWYQVRKKVGDIIEYPEPDERGRPVRLRLVGAVANSILQGNLIIAEDEFTARFPSEAGYRYFLVDAPTNHVADVSATLTRALRDFDAVLMRKDPPFDVEYVTTTWLLEQAMREQARPVVRYKGIAAFRSVDAPLADGDVLFALGLPCNRALLASAGLRAVISPFTGTDFIDVAAATELGIVGILLAHEMGHYLYCLRYGVRATLPYFIPAPSFIGTFGAFIKLRSPVPHPTSRMRAVGTVNSFLTSRRHTFRQ